MLLFITGCQSVSHTGETGKTCIWTVAFSCGHHPGAVDWAGKPSCAETGSHGGRGGKQFGINLIVELPVFVQLARTSMSLLLEQGFLPSIQYRQSVLRVWDTAVHVPGKNYIIKVLNMILISKVQIRWPRRLFSHYHVLMCHFSSGHAFFKGYDKQHGDSQESARVLYKHSISAS